MKKILKEHDLAKLIIGMLLFVVVLTWIIPNGSFTSATSFTSGTYQRIGLVHIVYALSYAVQNFSIQIVFLLFVGVFYGVLIHSDGYKKLIQKLAKFGKGKEIGFSIVISVLVAVLTSILTNSYILIMFMPFLIHVLRKMNMSKLSTFVTTFGAMLVGVLAPTYGTEGALSLINYLGYGGSTVTLETELLIRFGILFLAILLYTFFHVQFLKKNKKKDEAKDDDFMVLEEAKNKKAKIWPIALVMIILFVLMVLGFVDWYTNFKIEIFENFHEWFMGLAIGDFKIFDAIAGTTLDQMGYELTTAFGKWYLFTYTIFIALATILVTIFSKIKLNDMLKYIGEGFKVVIKPVVLMTLAYTVFVFIYWSPIVPTIINTFGTTFNPIIATVQALIGSIFNSDLGYLGYSIYAFIGGFTGKEGDIIYLIYSTIYGLTMFFTPVSMFLIFGLSYLDIPYKKWMSYIWKFIVAMLIILVLIFALLAYV